MPPEHVLYGYGYSTGGTTAPTIGHMHMQLGAAIRQAREAAGIGQVEMAAILGVNQGTYSRWEAGEGLVEVERWKDRIATIETALGIPRGHIIIQAGWVAEATLSDPIAAIRRDKRLPRRYREQLVSAYEAYLNTFGSDEG